MSLRLILTLFALLVFVPFVFVQSRPLKIMQARQSQVPKPSPSPTPTETWWQKLLRISGVSANPGAQRSPGKIETIAGEIWIKSLNGETAQTRIAVGNYRFPIFLARDERILALKEDSIVQIPRFGGPEQSIINQAGIIKLVGADQDRPDNILVVMKNSGQTSIGILSLSDNKVKTLAYETETVQGKTMFARILGSDRIYCNTEVYVEVRCEKDQHGECRRDANNQIKTWTDVMVKHAYRSPINLSNCAGVNCGQASLSFDANVVVYIKEAR